MCVIMCYEDSYPILENLEQAEKYNSDGSGIAWIENNKVCYVKGMDLTSKKIMILIKKHNMQLPIIIHFRIKSSGVLSDQLCHPFVIQKSEKNNLVGTCSKLLFHNGTFREWDDHLLRLCMTKNIKIPNGDLSDSRAISYLCYHLGDNYLNLIDSGKFTVMTNKGIKKYGNFVDLTYANCSNDSHKPTEYEKTYESYLPYNSWAKKQQNYTSEYYRVKEKPKEETKIKEEIKKGKTKEDPIDIFSMNEIQKQDLYKIKQKELNRIKNKIASLEYNLTEYKNYDSYGLGEDRRKIEKTTKRIKEANEIKKDITSIMEDLFQNSDDIGLTDYESIYYNNQDQLGLLGMY